MAAYGIIDELLQGYVGRSPDVMDLAADLAGVLAVLST
ncbi:MAG: VanZ family protein [Phycisphaerae bacterium]|nr:VanZ family protein [Phycisphaerae bacterium]